MGHRVYLSRARWGLAVVSAKLRRAVVGTLVFLYPFVSGLFAVETLYRLALIWINGGHWFEAVRLLPGPVAIMGLHALWWKARTDEEARPVVHYVTPAELLPPRVFDDHEA